MLKHIYPTQVVCIDPLNLNPSHYNGTINQKDTLIKNLNKFGTNYTIHQNFSSDKTLLEKLDNDYDIIFIDGSHLYKDVISDFQNYERLLNKGGFLVFDDYHDKKYSPDVFEAVNNIVSNINKKNLQYEIIGSLPNYQNALPQLTDSNHSNEYIIRKI